MSNKTKTCPNCDATYEMNYCSNCGQKEIKKRLTVNSLLYDFVFSFFHIEKKGFLYTVLELTKRPGITVKNFIEGKRIRYYPPMKYLVLCGTIVVVLTFRYKFFSNEFSDQTTVDNDFLVYIEKYFEQEEFFESFFEYAEHYSTLLNIISIPVFSIFSYLFFIKHKFNFAENLILNTYITAQQLVFLVLLAPVIEFLPEYKLYIIQAYTFFTIAFNIWAYTQFFPGSWWQDKILGVFTVAFSYVGQFFVNIGIYYLIQPFVHMLPSH